MPFKKGAPRAQTSGRRSGTPNRVTADVKAEVAAICRGLFTPAYWAWIPRRIQSGTCPPQLEAKFLAYAYGEPSHTIDMPQLAEMQDLLVKKLVLELHPSPSKGPDADGD